MKRTLVFLYLPAVLTNHALRFLKETPLLAHVFTSLCRGKSITVHFPGFYFFQNNMVMVGTVDCVEEEALCEHLNKRRGVVFYPAKDVIPDNAVVCEVLFGLLWYIFLKSLILRD